MTPEPSPLTADQAFLRVYDRLRRCAALALAGEKGGQSVEATDLVHLAYQRIRPTASAKWDSESFFKAAAGAIRRILIDRARHKNAQKRGGGRTRVPLGDADLAVHETIGENDDRLLALDTALMKLATVDPRAAELVQLRFFGGLTVEEAARTLGVSRATVENDWSRTREWLLREMRGLRGAGAGTTEKND